MNFKQSLTITTALSAVAILAANAAIAQEKPTIRFSGTYEVVAGGGKVRGPNVAAGLTADGTPNYAAGNRNADFTMGTYGELVVRATGTTESGMRWGVKFEDKMDDAGRQVGADETVLWLEGSWGKLELGNDDGAADILQEGAYNFDLVGGNLIGAFFPGRGSMGLRGRDTDNIQESSDDTKITYYTPRVSGFRGGVSYYPGSGNSGTNLGQSTQGAYEAGLNWGGNIGDAKIESAIVHTMDGRDAPSTLGGRKKIGWGVGGTVTFGAIGVGASYVKNDNWRRADSDQKTWALSANYNGGAWQVTLLHLNSKLDGGPASGGANANARDRYKHTTLQGAYNLGGGLTAALGYYIWDLDSRTAAGAVRANENDGHGFIAKMSARF